MSNRNYIWIIYMAFVYTYRNKDKLKKKTSLEKSKDRLYDIRQNQMAFTRSFSLKFKNE